jgi:plasmid stabilization system protein ParE
LRLRRVRFTEGARAHIAEEKLWWARNRDHMEVFREELHEVVALLRISPAVGTGYPRPAIPGVRRIYLRRLSSHLYYTFDDAEVIVRAFWHARRKKGPTLAQR